MGGERSAEEPVGAAMEAAGRQAREADAKGTAESARGRDEVFRAVTDAAMDAIILLDSLARIYYINPAAERMFGYAPGEALGREMHSFLIPERYRDAFEKAFEAFRSTGEERFTGLIHEFPALGKDGTEFMTEVSISSFRVGGRTHFISIVRDITGRKLMEQALRESEERYRSLVENLNDAVFNLDTLGRFTYISPVIESLTEYTAGEIIGQPFTSFIHPDDLPEVISSYQRTIEGELEPLEFRVLDKDGGVRHVRTSSRPLTRDGQPVGLTGTLTDITQRKLAEEELARYREHLEELVEERALELEQASDELRRKEEFFRAIIEKAYDIIAVLNERGEMKYLSPSLERASGYKEAHRMGRNVFDYLHPDDVEAVMGAFARGMREPGASDIVEYRWLHGDGTWHIQEAIATNLLDDPNVGGVVVNARDITDRRSIEEKLEKLNQCFLSLGPDPLENMIRFALLGSELLGADLVRYMRREKGSFSLFCSSRKRRGFEALEGTERYICCRLISEGIDHPVSMGDIEPSILEEDPDIKRQGLDSLLAYPIHLREEPVGCLCALASGKREFPEQERNILAMLSKAIAIEEERRAYEENLRDFIDIASHELRHPIALIAGFAETLDSMGAELDESTGREIIQAIKQSADRLDKLAASLLNVALLERDRFRMVLEETDLLPLIESAAREMAVKVGGSGFKVSTQGGLGTFPADRDRLRDLLVILLDNAVKYSPQGSEIELEACRSGGRIVVSVLDRGLGVPEEQRDKIFERFYQVEEAQYHSKPGMGLGLYLAREIVEAHGGSIWCEPREGGGSAFRFSLPAPQP